MRVQQFESFAQGFPSWTQLPGICSQRPGLPSAERLVSQTPEQHSSSRKQTSK
jgi:hypothetical protein